MIELTAEGSGGQLHRYPLDKPSAIVHVGVTIAGTATLLGTLPDNHALVLTTPRSKKLHINTVTVINFPLETGIPAHTHAISKPRELNALTMEATLSPDSQQIAWLFMSDSTPPLYARLYRLYAAIGVQPRSTASVWISKPDGSDMR